MPYSFSCGYRSLLSERCGNFFQLWIYITQPLSLLHAVNLNQNKMSSNFSEECGTFFQLWIQVPLQWKMLYLFPSYGDILLNSFNHCIQWNLNPTKISSRFSEQCGPIFSYRYRSHFSEQCGNVFQLWRRITQPL